MHSSVSLDGTPKVTAAEAEPPGTGPLVLTVATLVRLLPSGRDAAYTHTADQPAGRSNGSPTVLPPTWHETLAATPSASSVTPSIVAVSVDGLRIPIWPLISHPPSSGVPLTVTV